MNEIGVPGQENRAQSHGIPIVIPNAQTLDVRLAELRCIFQRMTVTRHDRATDAFKGMDSLAPPSTEFHDHDAYVEQWYLGDAARDALISALCRGEVPIWTDHHGQCLPLATSILFAPNKWERRPAEAGVYRPMNLHNEYGDDRRAACAEARLWVLDIDWPGIRDALVAERERRFRSELSSEWRVLLQSSSPKPAAPIADQESGATDRGPYWTLNEAVAWLVSEDDAIVLEQRQKLTSYADRARIGGSVVWLRLENTFNREELDQARERLRAACEEGAVPATGIPASRGSRQSIPAADFTNVELWPGHGGQLHRVVGGNPEPARWLDLRFAVTAVQAVTNPVPALSASGAGDTPTPDQADQRSPPLRPPISPNKLREWIEDRNKAGWSQGQIVGGAAAAFPDHSVPGRPSIRDMDSEVRLKLNLAPRRRGARPKGRDVQFAPN